MYYENAEYMVLSALVYVISGRAVRKGKYMTTEEKLKKYQDWLFKCSAYHMALNIIDID